jgi:iron transport multicopper oxidase
MICSHSTSHIEFHVEAGLTGTILEAPDHLQGNLQIPEDHLRVCYQMNDQTVGNAAGNTQNWLDLTGAPTVAPRYDYGYVSYESFIDARNVWRDWADY